MSNYEYIRPADIEKESMRIIEAELAERSIEIPPEHLTVVKRVIHTTADFDYGENLKFTEHAVERSIAALQEGGKVFITDTNMALAGISKPGLQKLGASAYCYMAEAFIADRAKAEGSTRAAAAMDWAAEHNPGAILAVGNAPTALLRIAEQIREDIESRSHVTREPVYLEKNSWGNPYYLARNGTDDLAGTYIEVDLSAQHVWFYKNGEVYTECSCVSGDVTKDHGTQTGCFPLAYKESPSVLTGGNGEDEYETEVNYWMPFYEGQGLHDATWRYSFGGSIYKGNGSHGCVNIPLSAAEEIYEAVDTGTAIIIFY